MKIQYEDKSLIIFESELFRTTSTIVKGKDYILVVDPNWLPREVDFIKKKADKIGRGKKKYLLFTHSDYDHIIGYGKFKNYKTIASQNFVKNKKKNLVTGHGDFSKSTKEMKLRILDSKGYIKELEASVSKNITFDLQKLFSRYKFPIGMLNFHNANLKLLKKEISVYLFTCNEKEISKNQNRRKHP